MQRYQLLPIDHPMVQVEIGGEAKESGYIVNPKKNPMFPVPIVTLDIVRYSLLQTHIIGEYYFHPLRTLSIFLISLSIFSLCL